MAGSSLDDFVRHLSQNASASNYHDMTSFEKNNSRRSSSTDSNEPKRLKKEKPIDTPFGHVDMKKLEHCARTLQKQIRIIINEAPDLERLQELLESPNVDDDVKHEIQRNALVKVAAALKSQYNAKELDIFDDIITGNVSAEVDKIISDRKDDQKDDQKNDDDQDDEDDDEDDDDDEDGLPPLPPIHDPHLSDRVFIHKSTLNDRTYLLEKELIAAHNERLEFLGDSILNNVVTMIIYERFDHSPEGELSKIRSLLVNNKTLAEFAIAYGLDKRLRSNISDSILKQGNQKIFADVFEAYIGALAIQHKMVLTSIKLWLTKIMAWKLKEFDQEIKGLEPVNKNAKTDLYLLIGTAAFHPQYKVVKTGDGATESFIIRCEMGNDVLGEGVAPSSKEAGLRAAMQALKNRDLLEKYGQIRLGTDRNESKISLKMLYSKYQGLLGVPSNIVDETTGTGGTYIPLDIFPVIGDESQVFLPEAKNDLYAILNKRGIIPQYQVSAEEDKFKGELHIKNVLVAIGVDSSKKRAATRAAIALLKNKKALQEIEKL